MDSTVVFFGRDDSAGCFYAVEDGEEVWRICEGDAVTLRKGAVETPVRIDRITFAEGIRLAAADPDDAEEQARVPVELEEGLSLELRPARSREWAPCLVVEMGDELYLRPLQPAATVIE